MKICFITDTVFSLGGIQRVVSVIASELAEDYNIEIICTQGNFGINRELYKLSEKVNVNIKEELVKKYIFTKIKSKSLRIFNQKTGFLNNENYINILTNAYYPKEIQEKFISYLNKNKYDIVIGVAGYYSLLLGIISEKLSSKVIGWQHNSYDAYLKNKGRYHWNEDELFNKYIPKLYKYLVLTEYDKKMFLDKNGIESTVMYNPRSFNSSEKSNLTEKQFLAAGRFTYQKGFDLLIESFYEFSKKNEDWKLVIVGEGDEKENITRKISEYRLDDRVTVENFTDNIKKYFLESSVLLLSSRWEGMPMIVLESIEMGVPVISYDITAIEALISDGYNGIIINSFDTNEFSNAMLTLASSYETRKRMGDMCIDRSNYFDIESILPKWKQIFNELKKNNSFKPNSLNATKE